jgi:hypothetical protein
LLDSGFVSFEACSSVSLKPCRPSECGNLGGVIHVQHLLIQVVGLNDESNESNELKIEPYESNQSNQKQIRDRPPGRSRIFRDGPVYFGTVPYFAS